MNWLEKIKNAVAEQTKLIDAVKAENRDYTEKENKRFDELQNEIDKAKANLAKEKALEASNGVIDDSKEVVNNDDHSHVVVTRNEKLFKDSEELFANVVKSLKTGERTEKIQNAIEGANTVVPAEGGFTVESEHLDGIDRLMWESSVIAPMCREIKVGAKFNGITRTRLKEDSRATGSRYGGARVYWPEEGGTITASNPEIEQYDVKLKKCAALVYVTDELIQDSAAMMSTIESVYPEEMAFEIDDKILFGDGVGKPLGAFTAGGPVVTIAKETSQTADTIVYENLRKMYMRMWPASRKNAVWLVNQDAEGQLWDLEHPGDSSPLIKQSGREGEMKFTIFGIPIKIIEHAETLGDLNDVMLADFSQYEKLVKKGIQTASSIHIAFTTDQTALRFTKRIGGAPKWASAKTPAKGSNTVSTFINLAARA